MADQHLDDGCFDNDIGRFLRLCQLRADTYCRRFGVMYVDVGDDVDGAINRLSAVAGACQQTPGASAFAVSCEEEWAADWLMDPRPDPPHNYNCDVSLDFIFRRYALFKRTRSRRPPIEGWPLSWYANTEDPRGPCCDVLYCHYTEMDDEGLCARHRQMAIDVARTVTGRLFNTDWRECRAHGVTLRVSFFLMTRTRFDFSELYRAAMPGRRVDKRQKTALRRMHEELMRELENAE